MTSPQVIEKWNNTVELCGPQAVLDELCCYMSTDDKREFIEHLERDWDVEL